MANTCPAPIDWRTDELTGGVRFSGRIWDVGVDYDYQHFRDPVNGLTYDNWFRITDAAGAPAGSAVGRERFARAQVAYPPSSQFHNVVLRAGVDLPRETQVRGVFSWSKVSQNDAFQPYSLNTALSASGPGLAGFDVTNPANLPRQSLDGNVRTINQNYAFVTRAVAPMTFTPRSCACAYGRAPANDGRNEWWMLIIRSVHRPVSQPGRTRI